MATMANSNDPAREPTQPICQNCETSTTPLWRRDESGAVLCNACGLFLKLHGRPRPISLKTDVIKSRNRVKTMRPDLAHKKKQNQAMAAAAGANGVNGNGVPDASRRVLQKLENDDAHLPASRTATPNTYNPHTAPHAVMPIYHGMEHSQFPAEALTGFAIADGRAPSPCLTAGDQPTYESLLAMNASSKTRISELEVIQELYRSRLTELEQNDANARQTMEDGTEMRARLEALEESDKILRIELDESHRRENMLKRRLDELEVELKEVKESAESNGERVHKKTRTVDGTEQTGEVEDVSVKSST